MGKLVVLIATLLVTALPLVLPVVPVRPVLLPAAAALLAMAWAARSAGAWPAVHVPLLFGLVFVWGAAAVWPDAWPLRALAPFLAYVVATALVPRLRETASWLRRGRVDRSVVALGALAIAIPALALVA